MLLAADWLLQFHSFSWKLDFLIEKLRAKVDSRQQLRSNLPGFCLLGLVLIKWQGTAPLLPHIFHFKVELGVFSSQKTGKMSEMFWEKRKDKNCWEMWEMLCKWWTTCEISQTLLNACCHKVQDLPCLVGGSLARFLREHCATPKARSTDSKNLHNLKKWGDCRRPPEGKHTLLTPPIQLNQS